MKNIIKGYIRNTEDKIISRSLGGEIFTFTLVCLFGLFLYSLDASKLPDFDAYDIMYYDGDSLGLKHKAYHILGLFFQSLGMDYQEFRNIVLAIGIGFSALVLRLRSVSYSDLVRQFKLSNLNTAIFLILIITFVFEYYVIRLRAGVSIFFFLVSYFSWQYSVRDKFTKIFKNIITLVALIVSAVIHLETFITIALFVAPPLLWSWNIKIRIPSNFIYFMGCFGAWVAMFWFNITSSLDARGPDLIIELNPIRFIFISIVPIIMWLFFKCLNSGQKKRALQKRYFPYLYELNYIASAAALFLYYFFSVESNYAGEAIVRVMTLSSFGAILSLVLGGITYKNSLSLYILLINSAFFINTIYG